MLLTLYNLVLYKDFNIYFVISFLSVTTYEDNKLANILNVSIIKRKRNARNTYHTLKIKHFIIVYNCVEIIILNDKCASDRLSLITYTTTYN